MQSCLSDWKRVRPRNALKDRSRAAMVVQSMPLEDTAFVAAIILIACAIIGGLAWVCRQTRQAHERAPRKKPLLSNWK